MTGLAGFVASIDRASGQLNPPDHARPVNQFVLAARVSQKGQVSHLAQSNAPTLESDVKRFASMKYSTKTERNQNIANAFLPRRAYANGGCAGV